MTRCAPLESVHPFATALRGHRDIVKPRPCVVLLVGKMELLRVGNGDSHET